MTTLWQKGQDFLQVSWPIMGGAMTWVSDAALVSAISNAGGFGVLASGSMNPEQLKQEIIATQHRTTQPFGVNLILMHPQIADLIDVCGQCNVSHIVFAGGIPSRSHIQQAKGLKCRVMAMAPTLRVAETLIKWQVDALIIEGHEAGGHIGPTSTSVLAQSVLIPLGHKLPIFVAGGIGCGEMMAAYKAMGAAGCQLGTKFVCAKEATVHENFKQAFIKAQARDATVSAQLDPNFPVIPVRALTNAGTRNFMTAQREAITGYENGTLSQKEAQLHIEHFWAGSLRKAVKDGDVTHGSVMAGQSVDFVTQEESCQDIIDHLVHGLNRFSAQISG